MITLLTWLMEVSGVLFLFWLFLPRCPCEREHYTCERCGGTFLKGWSDDEAEAESEGMFGVKHASQNPGMAVVCDNCFKALTNDSLLAEMADSDPSHERPVQG